MKTGGLSHCQLTTNSKTGGWSDITLIIEIMLYQVRGNFMDDITAVI